MKTISHKRFSRKSSEGVTVYVKDLGRGKLMSGQYVTFFYSTGHIGTGKVSRDGTTVYISLKNFPFHGINLPNCSDDRDFDVKKISILKTRSK